MTQTPPKPDFQNTTKDRSSAAENRTPATNYSPSSYSPLSSQEQAATAAQAIKPLKSEAVERSAKAQGSLLQGQQFRWWRKLSLRFKAATLAVAIGTIPVLAVGGTAYFFTNFSVTEQISRAQLFRTEMIAERFKQFLEGRYKEVATLAANKIFTDPVLRKSATIAQKKAVLDNFQQMIGFADSIVFFDPQGNMLFQSDSDRPFKKGKNYGDRKYFQEAVRTRQVTMNGPGLSKSSGLLRVEFAAPVIESGTGKLIGVIRMRVPGKKMTTLFNSFEENNDKWFMINPDGLFFAGSEESVLNQPAAERWSRVVEIQKMRQTGFGVSTQRESGTEELISYAPFPTSEILPDRNIGAMIVTDTAISFATQKQLLSIILLGTGVAAVLVSAIAINLANRATRPILTTADAVEKIGQGKLDTCLEVQGGDELAVLRANINKMTKQIGALLQAQILLAEQASLFRDITLKISAALNPQAVFDIAVGEIRQALKSDRVLVYRFDETWKGTVIAESVAGGWPKALGAEIADPCFADKYVEQYKQGRVQATPDIYQAGLTECHLKQLEPFAVKANLVAPILVEGELLGLLIAHQCSDPRNWEKSEIDFFAQLTTQVGLTLERANLLEQQRISSEAQRNAQEQLQKRALDLLMEVDPVSRGDLTIRARVTEDEIGTVADSYNSTIESLRKIVAQVQVAAKRVAETTNTSEASVQSLSAEAVRQAEEISAALERIQAMNYSARTVVANAEQAEAAVKQAAQTVEAGDAAMNQTVDGILAIQGTVSETAKKVKRLGESSQNISQVVNLISRFAAQTHLLALKASIEAARAGEEGQGFAVIADEVRSLAAQSAQATAEIETLTASIQSETNEVAAAMEAGTEQVAVGTKLVEETRQSLNQIAAVSTTINQLVEAIAQAAVEQSQASQAVTQTMADVAAIAENTSTSSTNVSASFRELLAVAQELQESVSQFKVK